ncbi:MAG: 2-isopropylmalate synthase [bacterium]|nr:2-isopropylmalate synthase [bacterium]
MEKDHVEICDVTLREGEQTPGVFFAIREKVRLAQKLLNAGLRNIEIGVIGIDSDEKAYEEISKCATLPDKNLSMTLLPLYGLFKRQVSLDIQTINIVVPLTENLAGAFDSDLSTLHREIAVWIGWLEKRSKHFRIVLADTSSSLFHITDGKRKGVRNISEEHLMKLSACIDLFAAEGAKEFIIADTLGIFVPSDVSYLMHFLRDRYPDLRWGVHFHNDFGIASANTLTAFECGASLLQTAFNRLGERSGIATTAEVVGALKYLFTIDLGINIGKVREIASDFELLTGIMVNEREPIVGRGLYWYETATPILAMMKHGFHSLEVIPAEDTGQQRRLIIGKHTSGRLYYELREKGIISAQSDHDMLKMQAMSRREAHIAALRTFVRAYHELIDTSLISFPFSPSASTGVCHE